MIRWTRLTKDKIDNMDKVDKIKKKDKPDKVFSSSTKITLVCPAREAQTRAELPWTSLASTLVERSIHQVDVYKCIQQNDKVLNSKYRARLVYNVLVS